MTYDGQQPVAVPTYELPPPPSHGKIFHAAKDAIAGLRTDPYVLATFGRFGLAAPSFKTLLLAHNPPSDAFSSETEPADVPRAFFNEWCLAEARRLESAYAERGSSDSAAEEWQQIFTALTPIIQASRQHFAPEEDARVSMYRHFYLKFARHFRSLLQASISRAEEAQEQHASSAVPEDIVQDARAALRHSDHIFASASLKNPAQANANCRVLKRAIHLHVGPTNSGKTHGALLRLVSARTGVYLGPLRLLAHEVWDRISRGTISPNLPARSCELITGEEETFSKMILANGDLSHCGLVSSTIEMAKFNTPVDVGVIDEIQMIGDSSRGSAWTEAFLGLQARELHLCGEPTTVPLIRKLAADCGDSLTIHEYERLTPLQVAEESFHGDLSKIRPGDCVVAFSRSAIFALKARIEEMPPQPGQPPLRCAVAYGNLPPEVRAEQAKMFNEGVHANVMVASDAIGMGLNLKIKRIIFESCAKFNGAESVALSASQIKQIAGRAGRFGTSTDGSSDGGIVTCLHEEDMAILKAALASPKAYIDYAVLAPNALHATHLRSLLPEVAIPGVIEDYADSPFAFAESKGTVELEAQEKSAVQKSKKKHKKDDQEASSALGGIQMYSSVYADYALLCNVNTDHYRLGDFSQQRILAPLINAATSSDLIDKRGQAVSSLTYRERELFARSPVSLRDASMIKAIKLIATAYCHQGQVDFKKILQELDLTSSLDVVTKLIEDMRWIWEQEKVKAESNNALRKSLGLLPEEGQEQSDTNLTTTSNEEEPTIIQLAQLLPGRTALRPGFLAELERQHRILILYIWFSLRLPLAFLQGSEASKFNERIEEAIQFTLEGMRSGRTKRLQALGRDTSRLREDKRERRQANKEKYLGRRGIKARGDDVQRGPETASRDVRVQL